MIIFLLSVWFPCSRNLHKNKNCGLAIFFSMHDNSRGNAILDVHSDFNKIENKLWSYFAKRVVFLL